MIGEKTQRKDAEMQRREENGLNPFAPLRLRAFALSFCLFVLFLAFFLRFHNLGVQSLWNDEGSSYVQATRSFADIAENAARDIHPPGYYWLLAVWRQFTGDSEFALRSLSAFASVLTVAFTYALGKRLFNPLAGLLAALFVALNTFSIYYAQEARMYALLALWGVMGMWALAGLLKAYPRGAEKQRFRGFTQNTESSSPFSGLVFSGSRTAFASGGAARWALALALVNAAGLYTQYAYPFVMLAQGAVVLVWLAENMIGRWTRRASSLQILGWYVAANVVTILLYLPWMPTALRQVTQWPSTGEAIPAGEALRTIGGWFLFGLTYNFKRDDSVWLLLMVLGIVLLFGGLGKWNQKHELWRVALPILWVVVPVGLFLVLELFRPANLKFLLPSQIAFALFVALGLTRFWEGFHTWKFQPGLVVVPRPPFRYSLIMSRGLAFLVTLLLLLGMIVFIYPLYTNPAYQRPDYRAIVRQIMADPRPGDAIILDAPNQEEVFRYYYRGAAPIYPLPPGLGGNDAETAMEVLHLIDRHERIFVLFWGEAERDPNYVVETILDSQAFQAGIDQWYGDVRFVQYVAPADMPALIPSGAAFGETITLVGYALNTTAIQPGDVLQVQLDWQTSAPLTIPYKVFLQLLNGDGALVAQRDSEPGGGSQPTTVWIPAARITDRHGLTIPTDLRPGAYKLIVGLYNRDDPAARLPVDGGDYLELGMIEVTD